MTTTPVFDGPRLIRREEIAAARRLDQLCFSGIDSAEAPETLPPEEENSATEGETYLIACEGAPVSMISIFHTRLHLHGAALDVGSIGGVCTHPNFRGQGLATQLLDFCTRRLVEDGARLMVISGVRGLYTRSGSIPMGRYAGFDFKPGQMHPSAEKIAAARGITLRAPQPADALDFARIYQAEAVHFERPLSRFAEHLQGHADFTRAETWIIDMDGRPAAYLLLNLPWEVVDHPELGIRRVHEYAGSRLALTGALAQLLSTEPGAAQPPLQALHIPVCWQDTDLSQLLHDFGGSPEWCVLPDHTWRIINFPGLMADLRAYMAARLDPARLDGLHFEQSGPLLAGISTTPDHCTIRLGSDSLTLDGASMTRLVFGGLGVTALDMPGSLDDVCNVLFPLPSFLPGLDYH